MRPLPVKSMVDEFWRLVGDGSSPREAGVAVGVSASAGRSWFAAVGGVKPQSAPPGPRSRPRLSFEDREEIALGIAAGESMNSIASRLGRATSTISREIKNNSRGPGSYRSRYRFGVRWRGGWEPVPQYRASTAHSRSQRRARRPKVSALAGNPLLRAEVQTRLEEFHSPVQIAVGLRHDFPDDPEMWVSHETVYRSIYVQGKGSLRRELHRCLRTGRALRKPQRRAGERRGRIPNMINISERPPEVADRAVPGHWEGDLILGGTASGSAIGTLVERTTRFTMLLHLPDGHGAEAVQDAIVAKMATLPANLRKTLTWDQGKEMSNHAQIAAAIDLDVYFCDPHSPWQRGTNENTNGLLRQWFAKGSDLAVFPADYLDFVASKLNRRPRETLNWKTPAESLDELLSKPFNPPTVASTT